MWSVFRCRVLVILMVSFERTGVGVGEGACAWPRVELGDGTEAGLGEIAAEGQLRSREHVSLFIIIRFII